MDDEPTVAEFVDYCRLQARLCSGTAETLQGEIEDLLDDLDADIAALHDQLDGPENTESTTGPESAARPGAEAVDTDAVADAESTVETKQALVEAKQARLGAYQDLAEGYVDLAGDLQADVADASTAVERIVSFEVERDAPAYFDERQTLAEAVAKSADE